MYRNHKIMTSKHVLQDTSSVQQLAMVSTPLGPVTPQVVPCHNWSGRTIHGRFGCHKWSALPQVVSPFILLQMPNIGWLTTCSLPSIIYMVKYKAAERGVATGAFCPGPHTAYGPQKIDTL